MLGAFTLALSALSIPAAAAPNGYNANNPYRSHMKRAVTADANSVSGKSFDYIVVGGGIGGLVVANRLSEWQNQTVLVIEAGGDGEDVVDSQTIPGYAYHHGLAYASAYGWNYTTVPLTEMENQKKAYPLGRGLGGSGAVNGMFWSRGSIPEYDAWATLNPGGDVTWNWDEVDKYIKKSEKLHMPPQEQLDTFHIAADPAAHGSSGPLQIGWSNYIYPIVANWVPTWQALGFANKDCAGGNNHGVTITPSTLDPTKGSRSDSRTAYVDGVTRANLVVLTNQQVTKITFSGKDAKGNAIATGVEFARGAGAPSFSVSAKKEVIVSGGSVHSPKLLQLSGIGPASLLTSLNIPVISDLPVGYNFQDHYAFPMMFSTVDGVETWGELTTNPELGAKALEEWRATHSGKWTYINEAVGYIAMSDIVGGDAGASSFAETVNVDAIVAAVAARHDLPESVKKGLAAQYAFQKDWMKADIGQFEIIMHLWGATASSVAFQVAVQHAWSRGRISIPSTDPFAVPNIDPDYFSVDVDAQLFSAAAAWVRTMSTTKPMGDIITGEMAPGANYTGDALTAYFKNKAGTEYHPIGTCSMLPKDSGGVVDTSLKIYGTANVRVVDTSIQPIHMSAHTMATTYGIAEKAADIIKLQSLPVPVSSSSSSKSSTSTATSSHSSSPASSSAAVAAASSGGLSTGAKIGVGVGVGLGAAAIIGALLFVVCRRNRKTAETDKSGWYAQGQQNGQWAQQGAYDQNESYPLQQRGRPLSGVGSISTMATADLPHRPPREDGRYSTQSRDF